MENDIYQLSMTSGWNFKLTWLIERETSNLNLVVSSQERKPPNQAKPSLIVEAMRSLAISEKQKSFIPAWFALRNDKNILNLEKKSNKTQDMYVSKPKTCTCLETHISSLKFRDTYLKFYLIFFQNYEVLCLFIIKMGIELFSFS